MNFKKPRSHFIDIPWVRHQNTRFERLAEGGVGIIAIRFSHIEQFLITFLQHFRCLLHSPTGQIFQGCFSNQVPKASRKRGTRHTPGGGQRFNRPRMLHLLVHGFESDTNLRIGNRPQQIALAGFRLRSDVGADGVYEQHICHRLTTSSDPDAETAVSEAGIFRVVCCARLCA